MAAVGQPLPPEAKGQARSAVLTRACFLVGTLKENEQKCGWRWTQPLQEPAGSRGRGQNSSSTPATFLDLLVIFNFEIKALYLSCGVILFYFIGYATGLVES